MTAASEVCIRIPNDWNPRHYQGTLWHYLEGGGKRAVAVWHRRAGKDSTALNWTAVAAHQRVGAYYHMLPALTHARKVVWDAIDGRGRRVIDQVFPPDIRESTHDNEMRIKLANGSLWQLVGSDHYDAIVGTNPIGVVFSEFALSDPQAWNFIRPILAENGGWALFIFTPRGENHAADLFRMAKGAEGWFAELLTVDNTRAIDLQAIEDEREAGMPESMVKQEFFCSFTSGIAGAYFAKYLEVAEEQGRVGSVPWEPSLPVHTAWDLGMDDATAIWFSQEVGKETRLIGYYENSGVGLEHYAKELDSLPFVFGEHFFPPDVAVRELGTGQSRKAMLASLGIKATVVPAVSVEDGINAVRTLLPQCWFDEKRCGRGLKALKNYKTEYSEKLGTYSARPVHDWSSHAADAFRYLAIGLGRRRQKARSTGGPRPARANSGYDVHRWRVRA